MTPESPTALGRRVYGLPPALTRCILVFPAAAAIVLGVLLAVPATHHLGESLLEEDHLVETLTFACYLAASLLAVRWTIARAGRSARPRAAWSAGFVALLGFGLAMEEVSWGERWLHFHGPAALTGINLQHESNVHNLALFQDVNYWMPLVIGLAALASIVWTARRRRDAAGVPSLLLPTSVVVILLSGYDNFTDSYSVNLAFDTLVGMLGELSEMLVAFGLALAVWLSIRREARLQDGVTAASMPAVAPRSPAP